ncbi:hypothetical protein BYT27DRAFT_7186663 [Phlegmacium glaucopus]|nr:hypothetical protein BYT27DRAFT_7186663 [Phlegmacium glaucopus]
MHPRTDENPQECAKHRLYFNFITLPRNPVPANTLYDIRNKSELPDITSLSKHRTRVKSLSNGSQLYQKLAKITKNIR